MRCCPPTSPAPQGWCSAPNPSTPARKAYPTPEHTPLRSSPIYRSPSGRHCWRQQNSSPVRELVGSASIYQRRADFPEDSLVFEDVPVRVVEDLQRRYLCCRGTYYPATRKLILKPMISPPHALVTSFFRKLPTILRRQGFITDDEEDMLVQLEGGVTLPGDGTPMESFLPGKGAPRTKEADFSLGIKETLPGFIGLFTPSRPVLVMECGVSERNRDLSSDAKQWLQRSGNIVRCVILVRIQEGPRTAFVQENSDSDSDSSNMAKYQLKEASFFQNQELTAQWAGELSAYAEIWRMNMEVERAEQQCHLLLPRTGELPMLPLRRGDLGLSPAMEGDQDEILLNMYPLVRDLEQTGRQRLAFWRWGNSRGRVLSR